MQSIVIVVLMIILCCTVDNNLGFNVSLVACTLSVVNVIWQLINYDGE